MPSCEKCGVLLDEEYAKEWRFCTACRPQENPISNDAILVNVDVSACGKHSLIAVLLKGIGFSIVFLGIALAGYFTFQNYALLFSLAFLVSGIIGGFFFIGFGEIVRLLYQISTQRK